MLSGRIDEASLTHASELLVRYSGVLLYEVLRNEAEERLVDLSF